MVSTWISPHCSVGEWTLRTASTWALCLQILGGFRTWEPLAGDQKVGGKRGQLLYCCWTMGCSDFLPLHRPGLLSHSLFCSSAHILARIWWLLSPPVCTPRDGTGSSFPGMLPSVLLIFFKSAYPLENSACTGLFLVTRLRGPSASF